MRARVTSDQVVDRMIAAAIATMLFGAWEVAARNGWIDGLIFPPPSLIIANLPKLFAGDYGAQVASTLLRFMGGALVGGVPGILVGLTIGWLPRLRRIADPFIAAIHPIPKIVLFPLFIVILGINEWSKIASIALAIFFPVVINAAAGARAISPLYSEVIRSYGGGRAALFRHVIVPGSLPMILSGVRIAANVGLLVTVAIEFTLASSGIGSVIWLALQTMRTEDLYAGIVTISLIGITVNASLQALLVRLAPWQPRN